MLLVARLFMAGEIKLMMDSADLEPAAAIEPLTKSARFGHVSILKRKQADVASIKRARELHRDLFAEMPPEAEDGLVAATRERLAALQAELEGYAHVAATPHHPWQGRHRQCDRRHRQAVARWLTAMSSSTLRQGGKDDWLDLSDDIHDVISFYKTQTTWRRSPEALERFA